MNDQERLELTKHSDTIRVELKAWEKQFAAANNGVKASRDDIKTNPEIAAKYKEYNKLRDLISGKVPPKQPNHRTPKKRKHEDERPEGLSKRRNIIQTPSKTPTRTALQPWEVDPYDSPSIVRNLFTPSKKALGPTPQKDGVVLGLFDLLQEDLSPSNAETRRMAPVQATPRKFKLSDKETTKHSRTPASASKQYILDAFATPLKSADPNGRGEKTPSSVSKFHFSTPSFLRRDSQRINLPTVDENSVTLDHSPQMIRVPRKPLMRGLSSILAGLRKMEEETLDDELEALIEMEAETVAPANVNANLKLNSMSASKPEEIVKENTDLEATLKSDSQPNFMLGGFDDEAAYDSPTEETIPLGRNGQPLKVYKKKGQKRTTKRVNLKPTRSKPSQPPRPTLLEIESEDELAGPEDPIAEMQQATEEGTEFSDARNFDSDEEQSEYTASEGGTRYRRPNQEKKKNRAVNKDGKIKTAARKVNALAHQNFKRLKLRNTGAKGGSRRVSRFRRK